MFSISDYRNIKDWKSVYPDNNVILYFKNINKEWCVFIKELIENPKIIKYIINIESKLTKDLMSNYVIYPYPDLLFKIFEYSAKKLSVVFIGQDPYPSPEKNIPKAMGLSFSVADGLDIPISLHNIYSNMLRFGHITNMPTTGNLEFYAIQGCMFLNTIFTIRSGEKTSHENIWKPFTEALISKISCDFDNLVFVMWGQYARNYKMCIDTSKHKIIESSHPSGFSSDKSSNACKSFNEVDHFGLINKYLRSFGKNEIIWGI